MNQDWSSLGTLILIKQIETTENDKMTFNALVIKAVTISRTCLFLIRLAIKVHGVLSSTDLQLASLLQFWNTRTHLLPQRSTFMCFLRFRRLTLWILDYGCFTNPPPSFSTVLTNRDRTFQLFCVYARCSRTS